MLIQNSLPFPEGFSSITEVDGKNSEMGVGFGILNLGEGKKFTYSYPDQESAFLLIHGEVRFRWGNSVEDAGRGSLVDETPGILHISTSTEVEIEGRAGGAELAVFTARNSKVFEPRFLKGADVKRVWLGSGKVEEETRRELRIGADDDNAPFSQMTFGEVVNLPGKWSSYPPHFHDHPEIYHYRFDREPGFGYAGIGNEVHRVTGGDTLLIPPGETHPQVSAPGYTMVYLWVMPHLPGNRFGSTSRQFVPEHSWVMDGQ